MSTATSSIRKENTTSHFQYEPSKIKYGKDGTNTPILEILDTVDPSEELETIDPSEELETRLRSHKSSTEEINFAKPREDIRQRWLGTVVKSNEENLTVQLEDLINPENPKELVDLSRDEIDRKDHPLIQSGALFDWYIGYRQGLKYSRERFSTIRFRRLPVWTDSEIKDAKEQAEDYYNFFNSD